jgi:hypothetical protein
MQSTREMRINQKQEIKTSTSSSTLANTSEATKGSFKNINQGRTLNIQFHEVNNIYKAGLVVEKLRLTYVPSVELIQGLGIHDTLTFELRDLGALLACANNDAALAGGDFVYDVPNLERRILRTVVRTILREYAETDQTNPVGAINQQPVLEAEKSTLGNLLDQSVRAFGLSSDAVRSLKSVIGFLQDNREYTDEADEHYGSTAAECQKYVTILEGLYSKERVLGPHTLTAPSAATHAEATVGVLPSTEPYSEKMREAEIGLKHAEIEGRLADAAARRALAGLRPNGRRSVLKATLDRQPGGKLHVDVDPPLQKGHWAIVCDGKTVSEIHLSRAAGVLEIAPTGSSDWPRDGGHHWMFISTQLGERLELPLF